MATPHQVYRRLLSARQSHRSFSTSAIVPRERWRGFLDDALKPVFQIGMRLPAAGGFSDYDIFLLAQRLSGKRRGLYRVSPSIRGALLLKRVEVAVDALQERLCWATGGSPSHATLVLIGRSADLRAKYGKRGAELLYQNVGVVQTHLYLTATAWALRGCAIGWLERRFVHEWADLERGDAIIAFTFGV